MRHNIITSGWRITIAQCSYYLQYFNNVVLRCVFQILLAFASVALAVSVVGATLTPRAPNFQYFERWVLWAYLTRAECGVWSGVGTLKTARISKTKPRVFNGVPVFVSFLIDVFDFKVYDCERTRCTVKGLVLRTTRDTGWNDGCTPKQVAIVKQQWRVSDSRRLLKKHLLRQSVKARKSLSENSLVPARAVYALIS